MRTPSDAIFSLSSRSGPWPRSGGTSSSRGKRSVISQRYHAKDEKGAAAAWRSDLNYSYRGEEPTGFGFSDSFVDVSEIDIVEPSEDEDEDEEMLDFHENGGDNMYSTCGLRISRWLLEGYLCQVRT